MPTVAQQLLGEGHQEGRRQGFQVGRREGLREGLREGRHLELIDAITTVIEARFGPASADLLPSLREVESLTRLRQILRAASTAASLDELERSLP